MEMERWAESEGGREGDGDCQPAVVSDGPRPPPGLPPSDLPFPVYGVLRHHRAPEPTHTPRAGARAVAPSRRPSPSGWCCIPLLNAAGHNARLASFAAILPAQSLLLPLLELSDSSGLDTDGLRMSVVLGTTSRRPQHPEQIRTSVFLGVSRAHSPPILLCWANALRTSVSIDSPPSTLMTHNPFFTFHSPRFVLQSDPRTLAH